MSNFWQRAFTGTGFVSVIILSILFGPLSFQLLFLGVALFSLYEFYSLNSSELVIPQKVTGLTLGALVYAAIAFSGQTQISISIRLAIIYGILNLIFFLELYRKKTMPFHSIAYTITGILYIVLPFALMVQLALLNGQYNFMLPLGIFLLIWTNDTFAYLTGMKFGKHRLFERISPKKSWEGTIGGGVFTLIVAYTLSETSSVLALIDWLVIGSIIVVAGTLGDLVESMLKRSLQVKDSGNILPGHGGFLDRFDALLLAVPFIYIYIILLD